MNSSLKMSGVMEKGYGIIPKKVMQDTTISAQAKALYAYLTSYAGAGETAWPGRDLICHHLGIGKDSFSKYLKELKNKNYVEVNKKRNLEGKYYKNVYTIVSNPCPKFSDMEEKPENKGKLPCPKKPDMVKPDLDEADTNNNSNNNNSNTNNNNNPPTVVVDSKFLENQLETFIKEDEKKNNLSKGKDLNPKNQDNGDQAPAPDGKTEQKQKIKLLKENGVGVDSTIQKNIKVLTMKQLNNYIEYAKNNANKTAGLLADMIRRPQKYQIDNSCFQPENKAYKSHVWKENNKHASEVFTKSEWKKNMNSIFEQIGGAAAQEAKK